MVEPRRHEEHGGHGEAFFIHRLTQIYTEQKKQNPCFFSLCSEPLKSTQQKN